MDVNIKITGISELSDKDFKVDIIEMLQQVIMGKLETWKNRKLQQSHNKTQRKRRYPRQPNENFRTKKLNWFLKNTVEGCNSRIKGIEQEKCKLNNRK